MGAGFNLLLAQHGSAFGRKSQASPLLQTKEQEEKHEWMHTLLKAHHCPADMCLVVRSFVFKPIVFQSQVCQRSVIPRVSLLSAVRNHCIPSHTDNQDDSGLQRREAKNSFCLFSLTLATSPFSLQNFCTQIRESLQPAKCRSGSRLMWEQRCLFSTFLYSTSL